MMRIIIETARTEIQPGRGRVNIVSFVVAAGTTSRTSSVRPIATGSARATGTSTTGFGVLGSFYFSGFLNSGFLISESMSEASASKILK
jgi:hypothetical protein